MGKYERYNHRPENERTRPMHPIWRGIGCLLALLLPLLSFALSMVLIPAMKRVGLVPDVLVGTPDAPAILWRVPVLVRLLTPILTFQDFYAVILLTIILVIILFAILSLIYAVIYSYVGPPRYTAIDAPPPRRRPKTYKR